MAFLAKRRSVVSLDDLIAGKRTGKPAIAITFDDAYRNVLHEAVPLLERYGFPATVFVPTAFLGRSSEWLARTACDLTIMTEQELVECRRGGLEIHSHGHEHLDLSTATPDECERDLAAAAERIEQITGKAPRYFAYPFGAESEVARSVVAKTGLERAFTIDRRSDGPYASGRVAIQAQDGIATFALKTSGWWLEVRRSRIGSLARSLLQPILRRNQAAHPEQPDTER